MLEFCDREKSKPDRNSRPAFVTIWNQTENCFKEGTVVRMEYLKAQKSFRNHLQLSSINNQTAIKEIKTEYNVIEKSGYKPRIIIPIAQLQMMDINEEVDVSGHILQIKEEEETSLQIIHLVDNTGTQCIIKNNRRSLTKSLKDQKNLCKTATLMNLLYSGTKNDNRPLLFFTENTLVTFSKK